jgi:hypothetical protein
MERPRLTWGRGLVALPATSYLLYDGLMHQGAGISREVQLAMLCIRDSSR